MNNSLLIKNKRAPQLREQELNLSETGPSEHEQRNENGSRRSVTCCLKQPCWKKIKLLDQEGSIFVE